MDFAKSSEKRSHRGAFALLTLLFFMWGFITVMNDLLISTFREIFSLSALQSSLVQFSFFGAFFFISIAYFLFSLFRGDPINKIGYKTGMVIGLTGCGLGCALFYPAAQFSSYGFFLFALFVLASGVTVLQIAANPYATILGSPESASGRLNLAQGLNSLGTTVGPIVGALLIFKLFSSGEKSPEAVGKTYLAYAFIFICCAVLVAFSSMPPFRQDESTERGMGALKFRHLRLGMIAIFLYVGAEVAAGSFMIDYLRSSPVGGLTKEAATKLLSFYWGGLMIGRLLGAISLNEKISFGTKTAAMALLSLGCFSFVYIVTGITEDHGNFSFSPVPLKELGIYLALLALNFVALVSGRNAPARVLFIFSVVCFVLLFFAAFSGGIVAIWTCLGVGLFNSIMWSNIFALSIRDLGKYTSQGSSLLVMAIVGGALIPPLQAFVSDKAGDIQLSYLVPAICYCYLAYYGLSGHKVIQIQEKQSL